MNQRDNQPDENPPAGLAAALLGAVQFLLVSPAFIRRAFTPQEMGAAVGFYPVAGLILGLILAGVRFLFALVIPPLLSAALILALWVALTGALHLDGFLDSCDGLLGGFTPEQRLEIMRDERVGAYALAGGSLLLLTKFSALVSIPWIIPALVSAALLSRWGVAMVLVAFPYARSEGLGRAVKNHAGWRQALLASIITLAVLALLAFWAPPVPVILSVVAAGLVSILFARFTLARLPGLTGDIYGAVNELVEVAVLIVWCFSWK